MLSEERLTGGGVTGPSPQPPHLPHQRAVVAPEMPSVVVLDGARAQGQGLDRQMRVGLMVGLMVGLVVDLVRTARRGEVPWA